MAQSSTTTKTTGGAWTDVAIGAKALTEVSASNVAGQDVSISLRLMRGTAETVLLPLALLRAGAGFRPRLPAFILPFSTHRLQAQSSGPVDWLVNASDLVSASQTNRAVQTSGDLWTALWSEAGTVSSMQAANLSMGPAVVSVRIVKPNGSFVIVSPEVIREGSAARKLPVASLLAGEVLQVKSVGVVDWLAFGVLL